MIARRVAFFGVMCGVLIAATYTGERLYVILFAFMASIVCFALLHILFTFLTFRFDQTLSRCVSVKGEEVDLRIALYNESVIPYANLAATYWLPDNLLGEREHVLEGDIPSQGRLSLEVKFPCLFRGEYAPGLTSLRVSDLFGLISIQVPFRRFSYFSPLRLTVRPRVLSFGDDAQVALVRQGRMDAQDVTAQDVSAVRDIRAFRPGDALKWVHFKLSARRRAVLVREFEGSARPKTLLLMDAGRHGREGVRALEIEDTIIEAATALAHYLLEQRAPVRLVAYGTQRYEAQGSEPRDFGPMYAYFTVAAFDGQFPLTDVLAQETAERGQHVIVVTPSLDAGLYGALLALREAGSDVAAIVVATAQERVQGVERLAAELARRGVRCKVLSPGEDFDGARSAIAAFS